MLDIENNPNCFPAFLPDIMHLKYTASMLSSFPAKEKWGSGQIDVLFGGIYFTPC